MKITNNLVALVFLGLTAGNVEAVVIGPHARAVFDLSTFSVTSLGPGGFGAEPRINWSNRLTEVSVETQSNNDFQLVGAADWTSPLHLMTGNLATPAAASANGVVLYTFAATTNQSVGDTGGRGDFVDSGRAEASRQAIVHLTGNGSLVLSVNYSLDAGLSSDHDYASAGAYLRAVMPGSNGEYQTFSSDDSLLLANGNAIHSPSHRDGLLSLVLQVHDGDQFTFTAGNYATTALSSVPLPTAAWLFLSALLGFLGLKRGKSSVSV